MIRINSNPTDSAEDGISTKEIKIRNRNDKRRSSRKRDSESITFDEQMSRLMQIKTRSKKTVKKDLKKREEIQGALMKTEARKDTLK